MSWNKRIERHAAKMRRENARTELLKKHHQIEGQFEAEIKAIHDRLKRHPEARKKAVQKFWEDLRKLQSTATGKLPKRRSKRTGELFPL